MIKKKKAQTIHDGIKYVNFLELKIHFRSVITCAICCCCDFSFSFFVSLFHIFVPDVLMTSYGVSVYIEVQMSCIYIYTRCAIFRKVNKWYRNTYVCCWNWIIFSVSRFRQKINILGEKNWSSYLYSTAVIAFFFIIK